MTLDWVAPFLLPAHVTNAVSSSNIFGVIFTPTNRDAFVPTGFSGGPYLDLRLSLKPTSSAY